MKTLLNFIKKREERKIRLEIFKAMISNGIGKNRGFEMLEILLVPHGGSKNDTIVTVERKLPDLFS